VPISILTMRQYNRFYTVIGNNGVFSNIYKPYSLACLGFVIPKSYYKYIMSIEFIINK
jgi:hypothetical protein